MNPYKKLERGLIHPNYAIIPVRHDFNAIKRICLKERLSKWIPLLISYYSCEICDSHGALNSTFLKKCGVNTGLEMKEHKILIIHLLQPYLAISNFFYLLASFCQRATKPDNKIIRL